MGKWRGNWRRTKQGGLPMVMAGEGDDGNGFSCLFALAQSANSGGKVGREKAEDLNL